MDEERLVVALEARIRDFEKQMQKAERTGARAYQNLAKGSKNATQQMEGDMLRSTSAINKALASTTLQIGAFSKAFAGGIAGGIAGIGIAGFVASVKEAAASVATIGAEARRAGVSTQVFQELKHVADSYKVSVDALTDGLKEMNLRADEFIVSAGKSGSAAEAFKRLGYTAEELREKLKDPSALFTEIISKLGRLQKASQIRIADEIFGGTGGEQFVQLVDRGAAGIRRATKEAHDLGLVLNDEVIAKAEEIDRQFNLISGTVGTALKGAIVSATAALRDFLDSFREVENQQTRTLQTQLTSLGAKRLEIETKILEAQQEQREETSRLSDVAKSLGFEESKNDLLAGPTGKIAALKEELEKILAEEKRVLDIIDARRKEIEKSGGTEAAPPPLQEIQIKDPAVTKSVEDAAKAYQHLTESAENRLQQMRLELELSGKNAHAADALRFELDLLQNAMSNGRMLTQEQRDEISSLSEEYGRLSQQIALTTAVSDLQFSNEQLGRTREQQEIYAELRRLGFDINSVEGQRVATLIDLNQKLGEQRQLATDLAGVFTSMFDGPIKSADEFFDKMLSGFARIGQANINKTLENLFVTGSLTGKGSLSKTPTTSTAPDIVSQFGDWLGGLFSSPKVISAQNKAIDTAAAKIPAQPLIDNMSAIGGAVSNTSAKVSSSLTSYAAAIKKIESGGNYEARGPLVVKGQYAGERAAGAYQVMPGNIPSWTKELLGYSMSTNEFLKNKDVQDRVFYQQFGKSLDKFGNFSDAASVWFTGQPLATARPGANDGYNTVKQYVAKTTNALSKVSPDIAAGAKAGVTDGIKGAATAALSATPQGGATDSVANPAASGFGQFANAIIGGLGTGYQSQDPVMGGISGALGGLAMGNPLMAVVGGVAGKFGRIFSKQRSAA